MIDFAQLSTELNSKGNNPELNFPFTAEIFAEEQNIIKITLQDMGDTAFFISTTDTEISCVSYIFLEDEVVPEKLNALNDAILHANLITHFSAFAKLENQYLIKGSLPLDASSDQITTLIQNIAFSIIENIDLIQEALKEEPKEQS